MKRRNRKPDPYPGRDLPLWQSLGTIPFVAVLIWPFRFPFEWLQQRRENAAFRQGLAVAWAYCETVWDKPYVHGVHFVFCDPCQPPSPYTVMLCDRLMKEFPELADFVKSKWHSENPVLAAYAIYCTPDPNTIPVSVLDRREPVRFRDLWMERTMPLGEWARKHIEDHNRDVEYLAGVRNTKDSTVAVPQAHHD